MSDMDEGSVLTAKTTNLLANSLAMLDTQCLEVTLELVNQMEVSMENKLDVQSSHAKNLKHQNTDPKDVTMETVLTQNVVSNAK